MMKLEKLQHYKEMILYNRLFLCFKDHYQLIPGDLSKQKDWDADPRATQKILWNVKNWFTNMYNFTKIKRNNLLTTREQ